MISLALAAVKLAVVIALLVWVPGWIASRRPLRPLRVLHSLVFGAGIYALALVVASLATQSLTRSVWLVPVAVYAIAAGARWAVARVSETEADEPLRLPRGPALTVAALVLLAAVLRWFHNFHYDDLQHLVYLTELQRQNVLFPGELMLQLTQMALPGYGPGSIMLGRYPYWAVSHLTLAGIAGVVPGDAYYLVGLCVLGFVLAQMAALVSRAWSPGVAVLWVTGLIAVSPLVSDNLLNFGGYPFQSGKLFVLLALTATCTAWRRRRADDLVTAGVALFIGPLMHTNNAIGAAVAVVLLVPLLALSRMRRPAMLVVSSVALLGVTAAASLATDGFLRWQPASATSASVASPVAEPAAVIEAVPPPPPASPALDPVVRRLWLFLSRGVPSEFLVVLPLAAAGRLRRSRATRTLLSSLAAVAWLAVAGVFASELARQLVTNVLKPGYLSQRDELIAVRSTITAQPPVVTDPITEVFGHAAGWPLHGKAPLEDQEQLRLALLYHPGVDGPALQAVLDSLGAATLVVNEQVVGAGRSSKFAEAPGLTPLAWSGPPVGPIEDLEETVAAAIRDVYTIDYSRLVPDVVGSARALVRLLVARPLVVFAHAGTARSLELSNLGPLVRRDEGGARVQVSLNSAIVTLPSTDVGSCVKGADIDVQGRSSFDSRLMVWPLDAVPTRAENLFAPSLGVRPSTLRIVFDTEVCGSGPATFFVHSGYWWDFRFDVTSARWLTSSTVR